jgi:hypothetical protein
LYASANHTDRTTHVDMALKYEKRKTLLAIWWPESEYKPLPGNSLAAFKEAIDRRPHYRLHTGLNLALSADLERQRVVLVR